MNKKRIPFIPAGILILSILACDLQSISEPISELSSVGTAVVQTLTAQAGSGSISTPVPTFPPEVINSPIPIIPDLIIDIPLLYTQVTASANTYGTAFQECPPGSILTGGGFAGKPTLFIYNSSYSGNGWEVYAQNISSSDELLNSYAMCLSGTPGYAQQVGIQVTAPAYGTGHAVMECPAGSVVTGGGFAGNTDLYVYSNSAIGNGWEVYAKNYSSSEQLLNGYAVCLAGTSGVTQQIVSQASVPGGTTGSASATCPQGSFLVGGGYAASWNVFIVTNAGFDPNWEVYGQNTTGSDELLNSYAMCLSFP